MELFGEIGEVFEEFVLKLFWIKGVKLEFIFKVCGGDILEEFPFVEGDVWVWGWSKSKVFPNVGFELEFKIVNEGDVGFDVLEVKKL